jgi:hypothetical protein
MPAALQEYAASEQTRGHDFAGPYVFHCTHRAYGVGMIDTADVVRADADIARRGAVGAVDALVATASHCHGAVGRLTIGT